MDTVALSFELPEELIARHPAARREDARLMLVEPGATEFPERTFSGFPDLLRDDDLIVFNNTRVFPARLLGWRMPDLGKVEALLLHPESPEQNLWWAMVRPGRKIKMGDRLVFSTNRLEAEVVSYGDPGGGERLLKFTCDGDWWEMLEAVGHTPLPPYILRARKQLEAAGDPQTSWHNVPDLPEDRERYQTVFAGSAPESVAAPTAGLHFSTDVMERIAARGIEQVFVNLRIGAGTFQPIKTERVEDHPIHAEYYQLTAEAAAAIQRAKDQGRRVVAVGTTVVRALESAAQEGLPLDARSGWTRLFIRPGFDFKLVDALLTNFHLPMSTLLLLVYAFAGTETVQAAYAEAIRRKFGFFSYGDCMFMPTRTDH
ncbi:TPA: tRNA preQ1(34) S-adenosylmethionine ribosyltransferase-isomerase QueA [Candidatus Sumerlaeota bacterium]|jgi:S-adenosylmethionine:tRNA ribosyltransferase-isomerase|nr:tRNA preQ1(34) S-adenosylmethionine ribosyltransferase-isomerase QueA [Candidatus Sumerlaeota bacterium]